jgi:hypothetical protein
MAPDRRRVGAAPLMHIDLNELRARVQERQRAAADRRAALRSANVVPLPARPPRRRRVGMLARILRWRPKTH